VHPGRWLNRRRLTLLALPALLCLFLILINDGPLLWREVQIGPGGSVAAHLAPAGVILLTYGMSLVAVGAAVFVWLFARSPQHRWPVALMLFGEITAGVLILLSSTQALPETRIDPDIAAILLIWTTYAIALFGFHILDPLPAARQAVFEQMHAGVVVFDPGGRLLNLNRAAETILSVRAGAARGKTWRELAPHEAPLR
jgi:PAS domain-containing protein